MEGMVERFGAMHPDLNIELTVIDREAYKTQIRNFLTANTPDVANWYAANRMRPYVDAGLFEDISDVWEGQLSEELASTKGAMTLDGKQWGVPYTYYQWGVYYRKDIFEELGLAEPTTFDEEKANCAKIIDSGRKCCRRRADRHVPHPIGCGEQRQRQGVPEVRGVGGKPDQDQRRRRVGSASSELHVLRG